MTQYIVFKVKSSIYGNGRGWCFSPNDFLSFGNVETIRRTLNRLHKSGFIRRLDRAIYDYPRVHSKLGALPPQAEQVAQAIARRDNIRILPSGAHAANLLGLSEQVPSKVVYLTEGNSRRVRTGNQEIIFKKTTPKNMATAGTPVGLMIQALKYLGKDGVDKTTMARLQKRIPRKDWPAIRRGAKFAPDWIRRILLEISGGTNGG